MADCGGSVCLFFCSSSNMSAALYRTLQTSYQRTNYEVKVDSGLESVQLPCKAIVRFLKDTKVEWKDKHNRKVHVYENSSDQPEKQHQFYRGRTKMKRNLLKFGDFSLTLKHPTDGDTNTYTCTISRQQGAKDPEWLILNKKQVELEVRGQFCSSRVAGVPHLSSYGGWERLQPLLRPRQGQEEENGWMTDVSLPAVDGAGVGASAVCGVFQVCQVEVEEGAESVQLPFKTTQDLLENCKVTWRDRYNRTVDVYANGSDQPEEQHQVYRDRTKMNEDLLKTGDLSLTLKQPTGEFRSRIKQGTSGTEAAPLIRLL
ncbi:hypothetical protein ACER0C_002658 [Sarotherodon galilaeus]